MTILIYDNIGCCQRGNFLLGDMPMVWASTLFLQEFTFLIKIHFVSRKWNYYFVNSFWFLSEFRFSIPSAKHDITSNQYILWKEICIGTLLPSYCFTKWKKTRLFTNCLEMYVHKCKIQPKIHKFMALSCFLRVYLTSFTWNYGDKYKMVNWSPKSNLWWNQRWPWNKNNMSQRWSNNSCSSHRKDVFLLRFAV